MPLRILFIVNSPDFFISHRLPLALAAKKEGYDVHVATMDGSSVDTLVKLGLQHHVLPLTRSGRSPYKEFLSFTAILKLLLKLKPELVHLVTIKPVLYGGVAARLARIPSVVAAISGLGYIFMSNGVKASLVRFLIKGFYLAALGKKNISVIFQNISDADYLIKSKIVSEDKVVLIRGSGVDLDDFPLVDEPKGVPIVVMASRLLKDKGVFEYVRACVKLRKKGVEARFLLVGDLDDGNPASMTVAELESVKSEGIVEVLGYRDDISQLFLNSNIVVLPSYREGLPKVLVEAAASGRSIVTTDVPGCRDAIEPNITGLIVPARDVDLLASAIQRLIEDVDLRHGMGVKGRMLAEQNFSIDKIVSEHMNIYENLLTKVKQH